MTYSKYIQNGKAIQLLRDDALKSIGFNKKPKTVKDDFVNFN